MAVPISAVNRLQRKEASTLRRIEELKEALQEAENELALIQDAREALSQGKKVDLRGILGEVRLSQRDYVLEAVKKRRSRGMTRADIVDHLTNNKGLDISPSAVTAHLYTLRVDGLVKFDGKVWRPVS